MNSTRRNDARRDGWNELPRLRFDRPFAHAAVEGHRVKFRLVGRVECETRVSDEGRLSKGFHAAPVSFVPDYVHLNHGRRSLV
jgi:hypothetical protein